MRRVYEVYRPLRWPMLGVLGFILTSQCINLSGPYLSAKVIDGLVKQNPTMVVGPAVVMFVLWAFRSTLFSWMRDWYELKHVDFAIPQRMQEFTLVKLFGFSIGQHTSENSGIKQSVISRGENGLNNLGQMVLYQALPLVAETLLLTGIIFCWSTVIGSAVSVCIVIYTFIVVKLNGYFQKDFKKSERLYINDGKFQGEVIRNIGLVMVNAQEHRAQKECKDSLAEADAFSRKLWMRFVFWAAMRNGVPVMFRSGIYVYGILAVLYWHKFTVGQFVMFMTWTTNVLGNLGEMNPLHRQLIRAYTSVKRYFDMLDIEPDVKVIANPVRPDKFVGRIEFKNVTFHYQSRDAKGQLETEDDEPVQKKEEKPKHPALDGVSFVIEPGQTVAFVGESGAGKSTLVKALIRAQDPESGQVIIDGNDLRILDLKHFREHLGIVDQEVALFDQTVRYNITYGLNGRAYQVEDHELNAVAEMSCVNRFYHRLEKGYDTIIGERGVKLSGGERQRVGIARALIKKPDILIFDEATSNLDSENENLIQQSFEQAAKGRTTIIIAHRFSTIRNVDKVIVLEKGKVVGCGTHEELTQTCPEYQRLAQRQQLHAVA